MFDRPFLRPWKPLWELTCPLFIVWLGVCAQTMAAMPVSFQANIQTDNWYPLPEQQMLDIVSDAALSELTQKGELAMGASTADGLIQGQLEGKLNLVGPSQRVMFTLTLHFPNAGPSHVTSAATSTEGLAHDGLFDAFQYIGTEAGARMANLIRIIEEPDSPPASANNPGSAEAYARSQTLKRNQQFALARDELVTVQQLATEGSEWHELASQELIFGLPMYEARDLLTPGGQPNLLALEERFKLAENRLREVIAMNHDNPTRTIEANALLDQAELQNKYLASQMINNATASARLLQVQLLENLHYTGECMNESAMTELLSNRRPSQALRLVTLSNEGDAIRYELLQENTNRKVTMRCAGGDVSVEVH